MIFNNYEHQKEYLESYGICEGDEVEVVSDNGLKGKRGIVKQVRLGFGSPLYNIKFHDGYGCVRDNRFSRDDLMKIK